MNKNKILIVEDEGILSLDMANTLHEMGYSVIDAVPSGEEALEMIKRDKPDLILMDIQLSGEMDGIQTAEQINKAFAIPIIYITGYTDELTLSRAKITAPYGYITKSFNYSELHSTIEMAIYKSQLERKVHENEFLLNTTLENIEDAVITIDMEGNIQFINKPAEKLLKIKKNINAKLNIEQVGFKLLDDNNEAYVHPFHTKRKKRFKNEYRLKNKTGGNLLRVEFVVTTLLDTFKEPVGYVYVLRDIEERKKIETISSRLVSIVESSSDAIIGIKTDGTIRTWNSGAEAVFGYTPIEAIGKNISMITPSNYPNELTDKIEKLKNHEIVLHYDGIRQRKNGELVQMSILPSPIKDKDGKITGISVIARDITEKKALEKEVLETSEKERERIGQDLHDSLGQQLTGILLNVKSLENELKPLQQPDFIEKLKETEDLIKNAIMQTRELAKGLVPIKLQTEGLPHALEDLANFARRVYQMAVETQIDDLIKPVSIITETQLYHIAQEAINNAAKHANCTKLFIYLHIVQSELILSIKDNGKGFSETKKAGIGLRIMSYRANIINGSMSVHSEEGEGTLVICRVPLNYGEKEVVEEDNNS